MSDGVFRQWWECLAAVPISKDDRDKWSTDTVRLPRYARLLRVWGDPTDGSPPPFFKIQREKHLVPSLWENFALFECADTARVIYRILGFPQTSKVSDLCWSYEFNLGHRDRQIDLVIHARSGTRDEVLVCEAKAGNKRFDHKDLEPGAVLAREQFRFASCRRYFLLGDAIVPDNWAARGFGRMTWAQMGGAQLSLCGALDEPLPVRRALQNLISTQFAMHGIAVEADAPVPHEALRRDVGLALGLAKSSVISGFLRTAMAHITAMGGGEPAPSFPYLASEPTVSDIRPRWRRGCGCREVNEYPYWRLPPRGD